MLSTLCSLLAILSAVPLALVVLTDRVGLRLFEVLIDLAVPVDPAAVGRLLLVGGAAACLATPVAAWLARVLPPWVVLLAGLLVLAAGYLRSATVHSVGGLYLVRTLHGIGAGCLLAATAALVGASSARLRPLLAAAWAAAVVGTVAAGPRLARSAPGPTSDWRHQLRPYPWLLLVAAVFGVALAAASIADRRPRLYPRWIDLAALLPLTAGVPAALIALTLPRLSGQAALLSTLVLLGGLAAIAAVAIRLARGAGIAGQLWSGDGRGAVGAATAAVTFVAAAVVGPTSAGVLATRLYSRPDQPLATSGGLGGPLVVAAMCGVLAGVVGALLPNARRRAVIVVGLLAAALGAVTLLPAGTGTAATLPGLVLLAAGNGLALGAVLRAVGPLATAVAGAVLGVTLPLAGLTREAVQSWKLRGVLSAAGGREQVEEYLRHAAVVGQRLWVGLALVVVLTGAAVSAVALAVSASGAGGSAR
jgi:hypothetical protein